jgi:hypothetical protein
MAEMHLANIWFGRRAVALTEQLQQAVHLGFEGIALLSGGISRGAEEGMELRHTQAGTVIAVAADQLLAPQAPSMEHFRWREQDVPLLLKRLNKLQCQHLLIPSGFEARPQAIERGLELLVRVRSGERIDPKCAEALYFATLAPLEWERQLMRLAAFLFALRRQAPGLKVALVPDPSPAGLLNPQRFALLQEEIRALKVGYWHDSGAIETRAMATGEEPGEWLDSFSNIMLGSTLHDFSGGTTLLPPGLGQVDWQLLREYIPRAAIQVLTAAPSYPSEVLTESRSELESHLQS